jgi:hypothetical protein
MPKHVHHGQGASNKSKEALLQELDAAQKMVNALTLEIKTRFPSSKGGPSSPITQHHSMTPAQKLLEEKERKESEEDAHAHFVSRRP